MDPNILFCILFYMYPLKESNVYKFALDDGVNALFDCEI